MCFRHTKNKDILTKYFAILIQLSTAKNNNREAMKKKMAVLEKCLSALYSFIEENVLIFKINHLL